MRTRSSYVSKKQEGIFGASLRYFVEIETVVMPVVLKIVLRPDDVHRHAVPLSSHHHCPLGNAKAFQCAYELLEEVRCVTLLQIVSPNRSSSGTAISDFSELT